MFVKRKIAVRSRNNCGNGKATICYVYCCVKCRCQEDSQCTFDVTLRRVLATIVVVWCVYW